MKGLSEGVARLQLLRESGLEGIKLDWLGRWLKQDLGSKH